MVKNNNIFKKSSWAPVVQAYNKGLLGQKVSEIPAHPIAGQGVSYLSSQLWQTP
jgi:hypothetical protein